MDQSGIEFAGFAAAEVANVSEVGGDEGDAAKSGNEACKWDIQPDFVGVCICYQRRAAAIGTFVILFGCRGIF